MDGGIVLGAPLMFALELAGLYACGLYAMGRLAGLPVFRGAILGRAAFYLVVFPGVTLHESAHYLACLLTGTKVFRFAPFSPRSLADGRIVLGYVRHEDRAFPIKAIIGLAPIVVNPLGLLLVTTLLTPLGIREAAAPRWETIEAGLLGSGFFTSSPLLAGVWAYLSVSFALGSVPSREDLASVPAAILLFGAGVLLIGFLGDGAGSGLSTAVYRISVLAAGLYALPAAVAAVSAFAVGVSGRTARY